jgi:hypothetical protein
MWTPLRCVHNCTAPAAPGHMPCIAGAPHRAHRPSGGVVVACGTRGWFDYSPSAIGSHQVPDVVVGILVASISGHLRLHPRSRAVCARRGPYENIHTRHRSYVRPWHRGEPIRRAEPGRNRFGAAALRAAGRPRSGCSARPARFAAGRGTPTTRATGVRCGSEGSASRAQGRAG